MSYFVMLVDPVSRWPLPLVADDDGESCAMLFATEEEAEAVAGDHSVAAAFGYHVFEWPEPMPRGPLS